MTDITTITEPAANERARNGSVILTDRIAKKGCSADKGLRPQMPRPLRVHHRRGERDLLVQVYRPGHRKLRTGWLGVHNPETFTVEHARSKVYGLKARGGVAVAETLRRQKVQQHRQGKTVAEAIEERISWMSFPVRKPDGEMRPRLEAWERPPAT